MDSCFARRRPYAAYNDANQHMDLSASCTNLYTLHNLLHDIQEDEARFNTIRLSEHHNGQAVHNGD
jgi:hypothetical protein